MRRPQPRLDAQNMKLWRQGLLSLRMKSVHAIGIGLQNSFALSRQAVVLLLRGADDAEAAHELIGL